MRNLFQPWRRKFGVVALVMACVFVAGWIRSLTSADVILAKRFDYRGYMASSRKGFTLGVRWQPFFFQFDSKEDYSSVSRKNIGPFLWFRSPQAEPVFDCKPTIVPYWSIVIPLTLLSAYLLLRKPGPAKLANKPAPDPDRA